MTSNARCKVAGAIVRPHGMTSHSKRPSWQVKAVFYPSSARRVAYQYPAVQSSGKKNCASPRESRQSSILGIGYVSFLVIVFSRRQFTQNRGLPFLLGTTTTGLDH